MKRFKYLVISILMTSLFIGAAKAASVNISCPSSAYVGDVIKCTITANNESGFGGGLEATINYSGVTYNSASNKSGSNYFEPTASTMRGAFDMTTATSKTIAEYSFNATSEGTATVNVGCNSISSYSFDTLTCSGSFASITITKKPTPQPDPAPQPTPKKPDNKKNKDTKNTDKVTEEEKSSNVELKELSVEGYKVILGEDGIYTLMVDNDVEEITIKAESKDEKSTIKGIGLKKLVEGENKFEITVTAEDGTTKTYSLVVTRIEKQEIEDDTNVIEEPIEENKNNCWIYIIPILGIIILGFIIFIIAKRRKKDDE